MDYIKSWYEFFRGSTENRTEKTAEDIKNEMIKFNENSSVRDINQRRFPSNNDFPSDILRLFFDESDEHPRHHDLMSHMESSWPFNSGIFHSANEMHREFMNLVNELHSGFSDMQNFIFDDIVDKTLGDCSDCQEPNHSESLRDQYLRVPPLVAPSENNSNEVNVIIRGNDGNRGISNIDSPPSNMMQHCHQTQQMISVSVGPDGVLEMTKIIKDSNGKTEKIVTKVNLNDKK